MHQPEADDRVRAAHQRAGLDRVWLLGGDPVGDAAAERRQRRHALLEDLAAGHLEDRVHALAEVRLDQPVGQAVRRGVDHGVRAELEREVALGLARGHRDHAARAERLAELHRQRADAAGRGDDHDGLARLDARACLVEVPRGQALEQQRQGGGVVDAVGDRERERARRGRVLGVAAVAAERDDTLARVLAHARDLRARDKRERRLRQVAVGALVRVGVVEPGAADLDQDLGLGRLGHRDVDELEHLGPAERLHLDRAHVLRAYARGVDCAVNSRVPADPLGFRAA